MSDVTRTEFDGLVARVARLERTLRDATVQPDRPEARGLPSYLDERFAAVDARFDHQDRALDALATDVQLELDRHGARLDGVDSKLSDLGARVDLLLGHFDIGPAPG